jgi:hypothetical protein
MLRFPSWCLLALATSVFATIPVKLDPKVAIVLQELGLTRYSQLFALNDVDINLMSQMSVSDYKDLGVESWGARQKLANRACASMAQNDHRPEHHRYPGMPSAQSISPASHHHKHARQLLGLARASMSSAPTGHAISPVAYGADPTGKEDSSAAFDKAIAALLKFKFRETPGALSDLGGAVLDLEGGVYQVSRPVAIPHGYANFGVQRGSLLASTSFPPNSYLLQIGDAMPCNNTSGGSNNKDCTSNVDVQQLTLDGNGVAFGGLVVENTMDANVGPSIYVSGFTGVGISLRGTGAGFVHEAWLGEIPPGSKVPRSSAKGTGLLLDGKQHDAMVSNVIVFSAKVGVNSTNPANRIQGVHTWNMAGAQGGSGIILHQGGGRVQQCYLDYAPLVIRVGHGMTPHGWFPATGTVG